MIEVKLGDNRYKVKTSWRDVTYKEFCEIISFDKENNQEQFISLVSGIPYNTLINIEVESIQHILNLIMFVNDLSFFDDYKFISEDISKIDVGSETWYKLEKAKQAFTNKKNKLLASEDIIKIYTDKDISQSKIHEVWGEINYFISELDKFFEHYKRLSEWEEDEDEFMANVKRFEQFGFFPSCVELSRKMNKTYNEVLAMTAREVYQTFLYDFEKADYEKTLQRLRSRKK